jgi:3-phenylpropionate/trans-cinnamate dioxygenase ferredoxin subunit
VDGHDVCRADELPPGSIRIVEAGGRSIGVLNADGRLFGVRNICPHQGAPLCEGVVSGTMLPSAPHEYVYGMENAVIRCPWHKFEFDLETGRSLHDPERMRVAVYRVAVEDGRVVLYA